MSSLDTDTVVDSKPQAARLGRYELLAPLASGGMAEVFVARAHGEGGFQRLVAVKRILPELSGDPRFVDMFLDEGRLAGLITSPNVVQVLDVARADDTTLYMVMELVRGVAFHQLLDAAMESGRPLPTAVLVGILAQAADGLAAAHEAKSSEGLPMNIVHRDVSPQNILVGVDGRARIADFGVARALHRRSATAPGELRGKLGYFAPEQVVGKPATARSDVFALSVVAWEAFAGRRLFRGASAADTLREIRTKQAPLLHELRSDVPAALSAVIARGLSKSPDARPASARALAEGLRAAASEAAPTEIAASVRASVGPSLERLEATIRDALDAGPTRPRITAPAVARSREAHALPTVRVDRFELDGTTTTVLGDVPPAASTPPTRSAPRLGRTRALGLALLVALGVVAAAAALSHGSRTDEPRVTLERPRPAAPAPDEAPPPEPHAVSQSAHTTAAGAEASATDEAPPAAEVGAAVPESAPQRAARPGAGRPRRPEPATPTRRGGLVSSDDFARTLGEGSR